MAFETASQCRPTYTSSYNSLQTQDNWSLAAAEHGVSKSNLYENEMVVATMWYLLQQQYDPGKCWIWYCASVPAEYVAQAEI
jgi:hypothetical protein